MGTLIQSNHNESFIVGRIIFIMVSLQLATSSQYLDLRQQALDSYNDDIIVGTNYFVVVSLQVATSLMHSAHYTGF